jgi:hypothetical protein
LRKLELGVQRDNFGHGELSRKYGHSD